MKNVKYNEIKVSAFCEAGEDHKKAERPCEDYFYIRSNGIYGVCVLCDGVGGMERGGLAAKVFSDEIGLFISNNFQKLIKMDNAAIRNQLANRINAINSEYGRKNFGTTLMVAALDISGLGFTVHIGDGAILSKERCESTVALVSGPENDMNKYSTYTTAGNNIVNHCRVCKLNNPEINTLIMITDGAYGIIKKRLYLSKMCLKTVVDSEEIKKELTSQQPKDDFSCAIIQRDQYLK